MLNVKKNSFSVGYEKTSEREGGSLGRTTENRRLDVLILRVLC